MRERDTQREKRQTQDIQPLSLRSWKPICFSNVLLEISLIENINVRNQYGSQLHNSVTYCLLSHGHTHLNNNQSLELKFLLRFRLLLILVFSLLCSRVDY